MTSPIRHAGPALARAVNECARTAQPGAYVVRITHGGAVQVQVPNGATGPEWVSVSDGVAVNLSGLLEALNRGVIA